MKKNRIAYVASAPFTNRILQFLLNIPSLEIVGVWTKPSKPQGRGLSIKPSPLTQFCALSQIPIFPTQNINTPECQLHWQNLDLDAALVVAHGQIIKPFIYQIPKFGTFNIHFSLLPKFRGASPIQTAILQGESTSGITLQKIDDHCDTGDIVLQQVFSIQNLDAQQVLEKSIVATQDLLLNWSSQLFARQISTTSQQHLLHSVCFKISKNQGRIFPFDSADLVDRKYRAFISWPGIFALTSDQKFIKFVSISKDPQDLSASILSKTHHNPGSLLWDPNQNVLRLLFLDGTFIVHKLQLQDKAPVLAKDFINGAKHLFPISLSDKLI